MQIRWNHLGPDEWSAALGPSTAALQQSWTYGEALARLGATVRRAEIMSDDARIGVALVVGRRFGPVPVNLVLRGPVWSGPDLPTDARRAAAQVLAREVPFLVALGDGAGDSGGLRLSGPRHHAILDLTAPPERLLAGLRGKWRNRLRHAEGAGLQVTCSAPTFAACCPLLDLESTQRRRRGYRGLPEAFLQAWLAAAPRDILLAEVCRQGAVVAAMLFLVHGMAATYHIGWSSAEGRASNAHNLALWTALGRLRDRGVCSLDLGLADLKRNPGLARFKLGTGAGLRPVGAARLILPPLTLPRS